MELLNGHKNSGKIHGKISCISSRNVHRTASKPLETCSFLPRRTKIVFIKSKADVSIVLFFNCFFFYGKVSRKKQTKREIMTERIPIPFNNDTAQLIDIILGLLHQHLNLRISLRKLGHFLERYPYSTVLVYKNGVHCTL